LAEQIREEFDLEDESYRELKNAALNSDVSVK
jgi:hypothetical protein